MYEIRKGGRWSLKSHTKGVPVTFSQGRFTELGKQLEARARSIKLKISIN